MKYLILMFVTAVSFACQSDFSCGYGNRCAKVNGMYSEGVCVQTQNAMMMPNIYNPQTSSCYSDSNCGYGQKCVKSYGSNEGFCSR